jgi:hypothetical protein
LYASVGLNRHPLRGEKEKAVSLIERAGLGGREQDSIKHLSEEKSKRILC